MLKLTLILNTVLILSVAGFSQTTEKKETTSVNKEWKEAMGEVEKTLEELEIPEIDIDRIMDEVRESMPTREELNSYKDEITDAVREIKKIDLSELERALEELGDELSEIFGDRHPEKEKDKVKKIE
jgi:Fe-S cluster assembly scaffold protein SufB